jgi:hypothetical protein
MIDRSDGQKQGSNCLELVAGVGGREHDGVAAHGDAVALVGAAEDLEQRLVVRRRLVAAVGEHDGCFQKLKLRSERRWGWTGHAHWLGFYNARKPMGGHHAPALSASSISRRWPLSL